MEDTKLINKELITHLGYWLALTLSYSEVLIPPAWIRGFSINTENGFLSLPLLMLSTLMIVNSANSIYKNKGKFRQSLRENLRESKILTEIQEEKVKDITGKNYKTTSVNIERSNDYTINAGKFLDASGNLTKNIKIKISKKEYYLSHLHALMNTIKQSDKRSWIIHTTTLHGLFLGIEKISLF